MDDQTRQSDDGQYQPSHHELREQAERGLFSATHGPHRISSVTRMGSSDRGDKYHLTFDTRVPMSWQADPDHWLGPTPGDFSIPYPGDFMQMGGGYQWHLLPREQWNQRVASRMQTLAMEHTPTQGVASAQSALPTTPGPRGRRESLHHVSFSDPDREPVVMENEQVRSIRLQCLSEAIRQGMFADTDDMLRQAHKMAAFVIHGTHPADKGQSIDE